MESLKEATPFIGMLMAEFAQVGLMIISKQAFSTGMPTSVFVTYSNALASLVLLLVSSFLYRSGFPPLTFRLLGWFFVLALAGWLAQIFGYTGINYSSPTLGTTMLNLVPGLTYVLAVIFRMEQLHWKSVISLAKLMGTIVSVVGAFVVTLYQGPRISAMAVKTSFNQLNLLAEQSKWVIGGFFLGIDCILASSWVIIQAFILKRYPAELIIVFFYCFFVAIQSGVYTLVVERDLTAWSLKPQLRLFAILYSAVFGSAFQVGVTTWCLHRKGPVFVCMFKPLGIVIAAVSGVLFFEDALYLGSLLGVIIIVVGFYSVMWGKSKEEKTSHAGQWSSLQASTQDQQVPLLGNKVEPTQNLTA